MLFIVMHEDQRYLDRLTELAVEENITDFTIVKEKDIGLRVIGASASYVFLQGNTTGAYQKAFMTVVKDKDKLMHFLDTIERDAPLRLLNMHSRGFMCAIPFHYVTSFKFALPVEGDKSKNIALVDFLEDDRIVLDMKASNKEEAIRELAQSLKNAKEISDFDVFIKDVLDRETLSTTGIGKHIAIPHARTDAVDDIVLVLGRSTKGIKFGAFDKKPAKIIILMATPKSKGITNYLKLLAHVVRILKKENVQKIILDAAEPRNIITGLKNLKDKK
jgi:fructose-specific phosphotransferase system IIA component